MYLHCTFILRFFFFFKQKTAYEMRISDWSSDVCSSDLIVEAKAILALIMRCAEVLARHVDRARRLRDQPGQSGGPAFTIRIFVVIAEAQNCLVAATGDRKSVVEGKSVSVRGALGGRRFIKKRRNDGEAVRDNKRK